MNLVRKLIVKDYGVAVSDNNRGIYIEPLSNHAFESRNEPALSKAVQQNLFRRSPVDPRKLTSFVPDKFSNLA